MTTDLKPNPSPAVPLDPLDLETEPIPVSAPAYPLYEEAGAAKPVKRWFRHWFPVILGVYFLLILGAGAVALSSLSLFLTRYEAGAPAPAVDRYLGLLKSGDFDTIYAESGFEPTAFTGKAEYIAYLKNLYADPDDLHTLEKASDSVDSKQYIVYRGDDRITTLALNRAPEGSGAAWIVRTDLQYLEPYVYTVSPKFRLRINGTDVSSSGLSGEEVREEFFSGLKDAGDAPSLLRYRVEGLLVPPEAEVLTEQGTSVPLLADSNKPNTFVAKGAILPDEESEMLICAEKVAKTYSEFLSKDAAKRDVLAHIYKGSTFYAAVTGFNNYWFGTHSSHSFEDLKVYNLTSLSPDDFTVEVSFHYVVQYYKTRKYPTHYTMTFLRIDDRWQLVTLQADDKVQTDSSEPAA